VKLHGTNASVCFNSTDGFWIQSRNNVITPEQDNAGFAKFADSRKVHFCSLFDSIINAYQIDANIFTVSIYGEWAGLGVQKGVGISNLDKAFYVFGIKISKQDDEDFDSYWLPSEDIKCSDYGIFNINDYATFNITIDFNNPQLKQNELQDITKAIELECPVAKAFGVDNGVGEGVVWSCEYDGVMYQFKVKGEKHSVSKVKTLASVDVEKLNSINEFIEYSVTENRFNQGIESVFGNDEIDIKKMGDLIRWVVGDVNSEEADVMVKNGLSNKDVNKYISTKVRQMFQAL